MNMGRLQVHVLANSGLLKTEVKTVLVELGRLSESRCATNYSIGDSTGECTKISTESMRPSCDVTRLQGVQAKPNKRQKYFHYVQSGAHLQRCQKKNKAQNSQKLPVLVDSTNIRPTESFCCNDVISIAG